MVLFAQGLFPLGDSDDDDNGPCEFPGGQPICGPHGQVWCGICCMDFSFENGDDDEDDDGFNFDDGVTDSEDDEDDGDLPSKVTGPYDVCT